MSLLAAIPVAIIIVQALLPGLFAIGEYEFELIALLVSVIPMFAASFRELAAFSIFAILPALFFGVVMFTPGASLAFAGFVYFCVPALLGVAARLLSLSLEKAGIKRPYSLAVEAGFLFLVVQFLASLY
ncbi:hypothetical protein [Defluviimonas sp. D31]|uniref:hypothetical protein n=1 Tax=Defluviimonas sp. D31 TaxID=3083253 RepID=UPI00296FA0A7|nr:hypothetical protein [Defluviimonas sp. D31]